MTAACHLIGSAIGTTRRALDQDRELSYAETLSCRSRD